MVSYYDITFFNLPSEIRKIIWKNLKNLRYKDLFDKVLSEMYYEYFLITKLGSLTWDQYYTQLIYNRNIIHCGGMIFRDLKKVSKYNNKLTEIYMKKCTAYDIEDKIDWLEPLLSRYILIYNL